MVLDPVLRFNWIFYAIFSHDLQHSAILSFFVSFSEVCRRAMWTLFRVENEHCTNVGRFRASRDVPLPYDLPSPSGSEDSTKKATNGKPTVFSPSRIEAQSAQDTLHRRSPFTGSESPLLRGIARVGTAMNTAHAQDFERRRPPASEANGPGMSSSLPTQRVTPDHNKSESSSEDDNEQDAVEASDDQQPSTFRHRHSHSGMTENESDLLAVRDVVARRNSDLQSSSRT